MLSRLFALAMWAAVAVSATFWGLRWFASPMPVPPGTAQVAAQPPFRGDLSKLLSGLPPDAQAVAPPSEVARLTARLQLIGVVAPRVALIGVDGKPPKAFHLGDAIDGALVLQSMNTQGIGIGPAGGAEFLHLALAGLPPPATGTLMALGNGTPGVAIAPTPFPAQAQPSAAPPGYVQPPNLPPPDDLTAPNGDAVPRPAGRLPRRLLVPRNRAVPSPDSANPSDATN